VRSLHSFPCGRYLIPPSRAPEPASPEPPVPDWSIELDEDELVAIPDGDRSPLLDPAREPGSPPGARLAGAEVVPPRSELPGRELCSQAPNAKAPATARIPIMSVRFIAISRVLRFRHEVTTPGARWKWLTARRQQGRRVSRRKA
jgi:hypothetical protein